MADIILNDKIQIYDRDLKPFTKSDVDEFTATRQYFEEYSTYTREPIKSERWRKFWAEERRRIKEGYHIGRDYISGYNYFYLNFTPIQKSEIVKANEIGQNQATRIEGFPDFWDGDYDFFHYLNEAELSGNHGLLLGSRGKGKSLKCGSMLVRNYDHFKGSKNYAFAYSEEFLTKDGILTKAWETMDFNSLNTPWGKSRDVKDSDLHRRSSKLIQRNGIWQEDPRSYKSEIIGLIVGDKINKARGKRGKLIIYEEIGMFKKVDTGWNMNRPAMEDGKNTFGLMLGIGTGGTEGADFEGAERMMKNPKAYKIYPVRNKWDENKGNTEIGYFWPADVNYTGCYDKETGISNREAARIEIDADRKLVATGEDPTALTRRKAELPLNLEEVLMRISYTMFPREELLIQEAKIENSPSKYRDADFIGKLIINKDLEISWENSNDVKPLYEFKKGTNNKNKEGGIIIYEHPVLDPSGQVIQNRYYAGIDSYDHDESTTSSLGSIFIGDIWTKRIVAEYCGRPKTADEFYEICRRLIKYYSAKANIESQNRGIFTYLKNKNCEYVIMEEPRVAKETTSDITLKKNNYKTKLGTSPTPPVQKYARGLIVKWLSTSTNNQEAVEETMLHTMRQVALIKELIAWDPENNFDRVDALSMLMLAFEENEKYNNIEYINEKADLNKMKYFGKWFKKYNK
jgi:hypothetical protein